MWTPDLADFLGNQRVHLRSKIVQVIDGLRATYNLSDDSFRISMLNEPDAPKKG